MSPEPCPIRWTDLLDPRPADEARARPIADAVNIPLDELGRCVSELPPRAVVIRVAGPSELAAQAVERLSQAGRRAVVAGEWRFVESASPPRLRLWQPTRFLQEVLGQIPTGRALDLACGTGRDAVYLALCGWEVTAVDSLSDALERGAALAARYPPAPARIRWERVDLEGPEPGVFGGGGFDLITCFRFLHRPLLARVHEWLRPGGHLLVETFTTLHRARHGKPRRARFVLEPGELGKLAAGVETRHESEEWREGEHTARLWGVKAGACGVGGGSFAQGGALRGAG